PAVTRERILAGVIQVIESGEEPTMRATAKAAQIAERTLYRHYGSLGELQSAVLPALRARAGAPMPERVEELPAYVHRLYSTFDENARLVRALTTATWNATNLSRPQNLEALRALLDAGYPCAAEADRESAAASLRVVLSASGWVYLTDCGFDRDAAIRHATWLVHTALDALSRCQGGNRA